MSVPLPLKKIAEATHQAPVSLKIGKIGHLKQPFIVGLIEFIQRSRFKHHTRDVIPHIRLWTQKIYSIKKN